MTPLLSSGIDQSSSILNEKEIKQLKLTIQLIDRYLEGESMTPKS